MGCLSLSVEAMPSMINCCLVMGLSQASQVSPSVGPPQNRATPVGCPEVDSKIWSKLTIRASDQLITERQSWMHRDTQVVPVQVRDQLSADVLSLANVDPRRVRLQLPDVAPASRDRDSDGRRRIAVRRAPSATKRRRQAARRDLRQQRLVADPEDPRGLGAIPAHALEHFPECLALGFSRPAASNLPETALSNGESRR